MFLFIWFLVGFILSIIEFNITQNKSMKYSDLFKCVYNSVFGWFILFKWLSLFLDNNPTLNVNIPFLKKKYMESKPPNKPESEINVSASNIFTEACKELKRRQEEKEQEENHNKEMIEHAKLCLTEDSWFIQNGDEQERYTMEEIDKTLIIEVPRYDDVERANEILGKGNIGNEK